MIDEGNFSHEPIAVEVVDLSGRQYGTTFLWRLLQVLRSLKEKGSYKVFYVNSIAAKILFNSSEALEAFKCSAEGKDIFSRQ